MERDFKICIECIRAANKSGVETPCNSVEALCGRHEKRSSDFLSGVQLPGCDKLFLHAVSVGRQKTD
jgi:hypothetical protein